MSRSIKRYVTYVIGALCAVAMLFALTAFCWKVSAHASEEAAPNMKMQAGASARLQSEGLRFIVEMDTETKTEIVSNDNITLELWIMPSSAWAEYKDNANYAEWPKAVVEVDEAKIYQLEEAEGDANPWYANGVLTKVNEMGYNKMDMVCVPVIADSTGETPAYTLGTDGVADTEMSLYGVLNCAVLDTTENMSVEAIEKVLETYSSWFGGDSFPIELQDQAAYDALIKNVNRGVDFSGKVAVNTGKTMPTETVDADKTGAMPEINTYYTVSFYEADGETLIEKVTVKEGEGISSEILAEITPETLENKEFDGWGEVADVREDRELVAAYTDVWNVTFYDADDQTVLKTVRVKDNECLTETDLEINVTLGADSRLKGWALTAGGETVADLTTVPVTENVSYYPVLEEKVAVQVTVLVEDYTAELFSKGDGGIKTERFNYLDNGNGFTDVMGAYLGDKKYTDKTAEFAALIENANLKGYVGDTVSLDPFKASLPAAYSWVAENAASVTVTEDKTPSVTIRLDANEEALGFSLLDVYSVFSYSPAAGMLKGLTLLEDGTAGVLLTNAGAGNANSGENLCLRTDAVTVADYKTIRLNFKYKAADYLRIFLNQGGWTSGTYCDPVSDWSAEQSVDLKSVAANTNNPVDTLRVVRFTTENNNTQPYEVLLTGLTFLKISDTENTALSAKEVNLLAKPLGKSSNIELTTDDNGVQVVRAACVKDPDCVWPGIGIEFDLSGITDATYSNVIVKFKVHNADTLAAAGNIRIDLDGGTSALNVSPATEQADLMNLDIQNWPGDETDNVGIYEDVKAEGLGQVWIYLSQALAKTNDFVIDVYSIEFVVNTAVAE